MNNEKREERAFLFISQGGQNDRKTISQSSDAAAAGGAIYVENDGLIDDITSLTLV